MADAKVPIKGFGEVGWVPDQERFEVAPNGITDLQNFRCRAGWAERVHGYRQVFDALAGNPYYLRTITTGTERVVVHCEAQHVYADTLNGRFDITPLAGLTDIETNTWTSAYMNGVLLLNNGALGDVPQYWNGVSAGTSGSKLAALPGWDANWRCKGIASLRFHWVAMGMTESGAVLPHRLRFSAIVEPGDPGNDWDAALPGNDADTFDAPGEGVLVGTALPMGDGLVIYKTESCCIARYVGGSEIWSVQPLTNLPGMLAPNCGVVVPGVGHAVLTQNGELVVHDGTSARYVLDEVAKEWLRNAIDTANYSRCYLVADPVYSEVQVCFPGVGNSTCTKALLWNWKTGKTGQKDLPNTTCGTSGSLDYTTETIDSDTVSFDSETTLTFDTVGSDLTAQYFSGNVNRVLMAGTGKKVFVMDWSDQADGSDFTGYFELGALCNLVPEMKGREQLVSRLWLDVDATAGTALSVYFGAADDPVTAISYGTPFTFTVGTDRFADDFACGAYPAVKIASTGWFRVRSGFFEITDEGEF